MRFAAFCWTVMLLPLGVVLASENAGVEVDEAIAKELSRLQGTWYIVSQESDGKTDIVQGNAANPTRLIFRRKYLHIVNGTDEQRCTISVTPGKNPGEIDIRKLNDKSVPEIYKAIYFVEGKKLKLCLDESRKTRPSDFSTKGKAHVLTIVLERRSEDADAVEKQR